MQHNHNHSSYANHHTKGAHDFRVGARAAGAKRAEAADVLVLQLLSLLLYLCSLMLLSL